MDHQTSLGPDDVVAMWTGRAVARALELACKTAVVVVAMALFLGMLAPRPSSSIEAGEAGLSDTARAILNDDGADVRVLPQVAEGEGPPRLIVDDPQGREVRRIEYHPSGPLFVFGTASCPIRVGLHAKPDGGVSWSTVNPRASTQCEIRPNGAINVLVLGHGKGEAELGQIQVPPFAKPAGAAGGP